MASLNEFVKILPANFGYTVLHIVKVIASIIPWNGFYCVKHSSHVLDFCLVLDINISVE